MGNSESSARFRGLILNLQEDVAPPDAPFWEQFWMVPQKVNEVYSLLQMDDVRNILEKKPENLQVLISKVSHF